MKGTDIYVSNKNGSDNNIGSKEKPLATVGMALRKARELRRLHDPSIKSGIQIKIFKGIYLLDEPIVLRPEDSGTAESPTYITSVKGEEVVLSGGLSINNWKKAAANIPGLPVEAKGKIWVTDAPSAAGRTVEFRQLWVNGQKAIRAKDRNADSMSRILSWNHETQTCRIPLPKGQDLSKVEGMEMLIHQWWAIAILRIKSIKTGKDYAELSFMQPESRIQSEHPWPAPWLSKKTGNSAFYLTNALQFLDEPGEWYEDLKNSKVYYWPKDGESIKSSDVVVPVLETLVKIEGTIDQPVSYVYFKGISFQHSAWLRPSKQGHVPHQAGMYMLDAYKLKVPGTPDKKGLENQAWLGRPAAALEVSFANHTGFDSCSFEHHASTGLDYKIGTHDNLIQGNVFKDIGGSGILVGLFSNEATEAHLPYNPTDQREISTNETISNNLITDVTNEDWGCVGIGAGYVRGIKIIHNEISEVSYSGISMGWGWTRTVNAMKNNLVSGNKIHHYGKHMYDVAGVYTLSAQPGSNITFNYVDSIYKAPYAHDPDHWFYLYTDEGSSFINVNNNWTPALKYLQNANGPGNVWEHNGPMVSDSIKNAAGLGASYRYLEKYKTSKVSKQPINLAKPVKETTTLIELVFPTTGKKPDQKELTAFCSDNKIPMSYVQEWNNRLVIYGAIADPDLLLKDAKLKFKNATATLYKDAFYNFNRATNCGETPVKDWKNIILTANLVKDEKLQNEYLQYHKTQFKEWPEVAQGFCNANFQQLLVFKNERQLMLVISIPKDGNLDELNPKTTENNLKVVQWNELMKKYQEGIPGTKPGEVWVFFNDIK